MSSCLEQTLTTPEALDLALLPATYPPQAYQFTHYMAALGMSKAHAKRIVAKVKAERIFKSTTHQVAMTRFEAPDLGAAVWLSIKRLDKEPIGERAVLGRIMRVLAPGHIGFELLPAPERLWDTANQYHCYAVSPPRLASVVQSEAPGPGQAVPVSIPGLDLPACFVAREQEDWRELYLAKERQFPGQEAAVFFAEREGQGADGCVLVLPWVDAERRTKASFPFGNRVRMVADANDPISLALGSSQRPLNEGYGA